MYTFIGGKMDKQVVSKDDLTRIDNYFWRLEGEKAKPYWNWYLDKYLINDTDMTITFDRRYSVEDPEVSWAFPKPNPEWTVLAVKE